jgi:hypothetical protein
MGKVIFLNKMAKEYHEQMGIKVVNPPELKVIAGAKAGWDFPVRKTKKGKKAVKGKSPRKTLGQRIYESLNDQDPNGIA